MERSLNALVVGKVPICIEMKGLGCLLNPDLVGITRWIGIHGRVRIVVSWMSVEGVGECGRKFGKVWEGLGRFGKVWEGLGRLN
jgi:hypothetical protein